jgi:hypothetical protein
MGKAREERGLAKIKEYLVNVADFVDNMEKQLCE